MESVREKLQIFVRRFGLLSATCCDLCCGEQVSLVQSHVLFEIRRMGEPSIQRLAEELGIDITTFSRQAKSLEGKGLIERRPSRDDRRVTLLLLTDQGRKVLEQIDRYMEEKIQRIFSSMSEFERETVIRSFGLFNEALASAGTIKNEG